MGGIVLSSRRLYTSLHYRFVAFAKRNDQFQALNTELIGLSIDQIFAHIKWEEWIKEKLGVEIPFPIIATIQVR